MKELSITVPFIRHFNRIIAVRLHDSGLRFRPDTIDLDLGGMAEYIESQLRNSSIGFRSLQWFKFQVGFVEDGVPTSDEFYRYDFIAFLDDHIISLRYVGKWTDA